MYTIYIYHILALINAFLYCLKHGAEGMPGLWYIGGGQTGQVTLSIY